MSEKPESSDVEIEGEAPNDEGSPIIEVVSAGYAFEGDTIQLGGLMVDGEAVDPVIDIALPLSMVNRHGLVAGATGTGKTKTLQLMAEQLSSAGVPVFAADIKGDLSGLATPGEGGEKLEARTKTVGQEWEAKTFPVDYFALGGDGIGVPIRVTMESFGSVMLSKVLGLNSTQESSLGLVFHYAKQNQLDLVTLDDLRAVLQWLLSDDGKADLKGLGGLASSTAGVILRSLITFSSQGADAFFGEPSFDTADLLRVDDDGRGVISLLELPNLQDRPDVFSTFLMWLLAELFRTLPEEGDVEKPKLVFFFDEAHLLFNDASDAFLDQIVQTVRLIRSKGVGVFFVTQAPTDVPDDVLSQLGSRVQHQLRVNTPKEGKALKATVATYPHSAYDDLGQVIQTLGIGEAVATVMNDKGSPTPVAWTRMVAPESLMDPTPEADMTATAEASPLGEKYAQVEEADGEDAEPSTADKLETKAHDAEAARQKELDDKEAAKKSTSSTKSTSSKKDDGMLDSVLKSSAVKNALNTAAREFVRGIFRKR